MHTVMHFCPHVLFSTGLPKFTDLNITVAARTSVGLGPASPPVPVKTSPSGELSSCLIRLF